MSLAKIIDLETRGDDDGWLVAIESNRSIPFEVQRVFYIFDTKEGVIRGFHAHKKLRQMLICISGSCTILLDDGKEKEDVYLNDKTKALLLEPHLWHEMKDFSSDAVLISLASLPYDESDYLRDYQGFLDYWKGEE